MSRALQRVAKAEIVEAGFDYSAVPQPVADRLRSRAERIRRFTRQTLEIADKVGRELIAAQEELEHGKFLAWIERDVGMSKSAAYRAMDIARNLGTKLPTLGSLPLTIVHQLAAPSTPAPVRDAVVSRLDGGESLAPAVILDIVRTGRSEAEKAEKDAKLTPEQRKAAAEKEKRQKQAHRRWEAERVKERADADARAVTEAAASTALADLLTDKLTADDARRAVDLFRASGSWSSPKIRERMASKLQYFPSDTHEG